MALRMKGLLGEILVLRNYIGPVLQITFFYVTLYDILKKYNTTFWLKVYALKSISFTLYNNLKICYTLFSFFF